MPATSEPAPGSVIPSAPIFSPAIPGTSQRCFCSSRAEVEDRRHRDRGVGVEPGGDAAGAARAGQLLDPDRVVQVGAALAAVGLGELQPEEAELGAALVELAGEFARRLPLVDVGRDLLLDEAADRLAQLLVLLAEGRQGRPRAAVLDHGHRREASAFTGSIRAVNGMVTEAQHVVNRRSSAPRLASISARSPPRQARKTRKEKQVIRRKQMLSLLVAGALGIGAAVPGCRHGLAAELAAA